VNYNAHGQAYCTESELCDLLYQNPDLTLENFLVTEVQTYNSALKKYHLDVPRLNLYQTPTELLADFDRAQQSHWYMPEEYQNLDIAAWVLDQCETQAELQRVGTELLLYQERDLFNLLRYLKYFVDTMRANNIVWGVGRGSSTASYVLYLMGVHRINSMYYDLPIEEFLR
jgi:DNA polymerase III alpha subunit